MAKGHSGNAFSTDFTGLFAGLPSEEKPSKENDVENKMAPTPKITNKPSAAKTKPVETKASGKPIETTPKEAKKEISKPQAKVETPVALKNPKSIVAAANDEVYMNIFMVTQEERDYLKFRSTELDMSTSDFFVSLIQADTEDIKAKKIDLSDEKHAEFKGLSLSVNTSIKVKTDIKQQIKKNSIRHRLSVQRYCAYIIHQAILNDDEWY
ncbi:hypothetical protein SAMN02910298_02845 [Pseudobutyrivibrio sp. YE44]|uniref:hypothetical protein n=1 Tax=Pseudobutyrivibrio sp. YE44 TaxID=1520802 RepID=UPI0008861464|nr:hypothetical protein [Pseudobutyrivibrio sp. YE44]SDB55439.1 hypothetical protein SAMN02910298_02845 [Pseudobutyrivibrio sp. YE44]